MEEGPKSNPTLAYGPDETTPLVQAAVQSAPPVHWNVTPQMYYVGQQPQSGQYILPKPPGQSNPGTITFQGAPPVSAHPQPSYSAPHSHLPFAITTTVICCILNVTSLLFGIPAVILAIIATHRIVNGHWKSAKTMATVSFYLSIMNWVYTLGIAVVTLGSVMSATYCSYDVYPCNLHGCLKYYLTCGY